MPRVIVFDVNETLLDLGALDLHFRRVFGAGGVRGEWFTQVIELAIVATATNVYFDFAVVGDAALTMVAARHGVALDLLRDAGFRLATLTNSNAEAAEAQLGHAGLRGYFEQVVSVERVRRLKPAPEVYRMAAASLGVPVGGMRLVAAHAWDVTGALRAGCAAAFVSRPGKVLDPLAPRPDVVGPDLEAVAAKLVAVER